MTRPSDIAAIVREYGDKGVSWDELSSVLRTAHRHPTGGLTP